MNRWLCKPWCIGIITLFLVGADQLTKVLAVRFLKGQDPFVLWDGVFELRYLENRGAAFGIFQGQRTFFLVMGLLVFAAGVFLFLHMSKEARFLPLRLVGIFVMAGAWGNMLDRLRLSYVVDFFYFKLIDFPVFNVADIYVSVAVAVFALLIFFFYTDEDLQKLFVKNPGEEREQAMNKISLSVDESHAEERADQFLHAMLPNQSRSYLQKLIKDGSVLVNGRQIKASYRMEEEDLVELEMPDLKELEVIAEDIPLSILYEDADLLIVDKPKGMVVHPSAGHQTGTLVNAVLFHCQGQLSGINGVMRPGIVHRIDRDTTGALVVCKNDHAHCHVAAQLKEHSINRRYLAVVEGVIKEEEGCVDAPIGRHPTERKKMACGVKNGKRAVTHYRVLERYRNHTLVECRLETGRTHQIRVHMASIHHPVLGDPVYGPARSKNPFHLEGQALHARILGLIHPSTGVYVEAKAPLPEYFELLLKKL